VRKKLIEHVKVLAEAWDENINGHIFTIRLAEMIADAYDAQPSRKGKHSIKDSSRSWLRLIQNTEKKKIQLSSSKEIPLFFEGIHDNEDFKITITRTAFEERNKDLLSKILNPIQEILVS